MAYITTEEVKEIRKALKARFPSVKFSVRRPNDYNVEVSILKGDWDFSTILNDRDYMSIINPSEQKFGRFVNVFNDIIDIIKKAPANAEGGSAWYDKSDAMTDYFDTAFYFNLEIGKWDKPYEQIVA